MAQEYILTDKGGGDGETRHAQTAKQIEKSNRRVCMYQARVGVEVRHSPVGTPEGKQRLVS